MGKKKRKIRETVEMSEDEISEDYDSEIEKRRRIKYRMKNKQNKFIKKEFKKTKSPIAYKNRKGVEGTMEGMLKDID